MKPPLIGLSLIVAAFLPVSEAVAAGRDWSEVQLAWRDDPRPAADAPFEAEMPRGRRGSRRSQRRTVTRRMPLDGIPIDIGSGLPVDPLAPAMPWLETAPAAEPRLPFDATLKGLPEQAHAPLHGALLPLAPAAEPTDPAARPLVHRDQPSVPNPDSRQRFDIFLPPGCAGGGRLPLVVWIHGDTWRDGSKADCPVRWLVDDGYAVASVGYRLSTTATFPAQLDDCRAAVDAIARNADVWGIDRERIAVVGAGAGGHLAALVGLADPDEGQPDGPLVQASPISTAAEPEESAGKAAAGRIAAVVAIAAPSHLTSLGAMHDRPSSPSSQLVGGPLPEFREAAQRASPLAHVSADDPACLVIHGDRDESVPVEQGMRLDAALKAAGVDSGLVVLANAGHKPPLDRNTPAGRALLEFLDRTLGPGLGSAAGLPRPSLVPSSVEPPSVVVPAVR